MVLFLKKYAGLNSLKKICVVSRMDILEEIEEIEDPLVEMSNSHFGIKYLYPFQRLVISNILEAADVDENMDRVSKQIVILPTGAGKSLCFMLPALFLTGPTLIIFPLLSLISDQLRRCEQANVSAAKLIGGQTEKERAEILKKTKNGEIKIVLTNPETAISKKVLEKIRDCNFKHLVFDEVHTVSEWGKTFRPSYLECRKIYTRGEIPIVTAFTATASEKILNNIKEILFPNSNPHLVNANPDRPNISYTVIPSVCKSLTVENLFKEPSDLIKLPALIFCASRKSAEKVALELRIRLETDRVFFYHAGLSREEKDKIEKWFFSSKQGILCATTAYGMGIDKPDIRTVIHFDLSPSIEAYLQESGRAGRDREKAEAVLILAPSDIVVSKKGNDRLSSPRYKKLLGFALNTKRCRRESLLELIGAEPDVCFGCDVCRKKLKNTADMELEIIRLVKHNKRSITTKSASQLLLRLYPLLRDQDIKKLVEEMLLSGKIKKIQSFPFRGRLK